jgi:hypothetical protein
MVVGMRGVWVELPLAFHQGQRSSSMAWGASVRGEQHPEDQPLLGTLSHGGSCSASKLLCMAPWYAVAWSEVCAVLFFLGGGCRWDLGGCT